MTSLVNNLGGTAGFGEFSLARNDDSSTPFIDVRPIFGAQGINFFGHYYTGFYLNNNGSVTFNTATSSFTPTAITGSTSNPVIAAYWADIDTRGGAVTPSAGGTSTGSNLLWYDLDATTHTFTATWDDVGYYNSQTNKLNAFQISIHEINDQGDFDIIYRYENIDWTTGNASGGSNGLGGTPARAGYSAGNGTEYFELPQSGNQAGLLALESASNVGTLGTFVFSVRSGVPTVGITVGDASQGEGDGPAPGFVVVPVFLTEPSASTVTVHYSTANGTALAGQDYVAQSGTLTFAPGVTQQNILVAITDDPVVEGDETFTVTLSDPSAGASILDGTATGTIVDDDASLSIAATSADKAEGQSGSTAFTFTVSRTGDLSSADSAQWAVSGAGVNGADFAGGVLPSGLVSFATGESSKVITVNVAGDTQVEGNETFTVTLSNPGPGSTIGTASASGVIRNDDVAPASLSIAATSADKAEGQSGTTAFTFTVTRADDLSGTTSASWAVIGPAVNGADFTDGVLPTGVVSFAAGESSKVITIDVAGDTAVESNEAFSVTLSNPSGGAVIGTASASGVIRNDDASLSITATGADKAEGQSGTTAFTFTVTRTGDLSGAANAHWAVGGAGVDGADFVGNVLPSGQVSFAAGENSKVITIDVAGDTAVESNEAFSVTLSNPGAGAVLGTASAAGVIRNDDASLSITATGADKAEGQSGTTAFTFTVTRTGDLSGAANAHWAVGGGGVDGADFVGNVLPSGQVSFAAGENSKVITIDVAGDTAVESNEAFSVTLSNPGAGAILGTASATGVIHNDDAALSIAAASADKAEGDLGATPFTFTVTRTGDLSGTTSAHWAVGGTEVNGADFVASESLLKIVDFSSYLASFFDTNFPDVPYLGGPLPSGNVNFDAGESSKTVTVWGLGETVLEGDEHFSVTLSNPSAGAVIDAASAVGIIHNDDGPTAGSVSISDVTVTEGDIGTQLATFTVTRTEGTAAFNVHYATADGTAMTADGDYAATSGTLHFGVGVDVQTFSVLVNGDNGFESDELFFVDLSGATHGAVLDIGTGVGTILNDDIAPGPITLVGTPGDDNLTGGPGDDVIIGLAGADILSGGGGNDSLDGGHGTDVLIGGLGADMFSGGDGDDYLLIDGADTAIDGGAGFDSVFVLTSAPVTLDMGAASIEWAQGNDGGDTFNAASQTGAVYIYGMGGNDTLTGSAFGDYLDGGDGADTLAGGDGNDLLVGNGGSDILLGQGGDDSLIEQGGDSVIDGGAGFDSLFVWSDTGVTLNLATASIEWVQGSVLGDDNLNGAGNTVNTYLYGWGGNDTLTGGSGDDYIAGGAGNDVLTGGAGNDTLIGEGGTDRYVYTAAAWGSDTIHSFDPTSEKLDFTAVASIHSFADFTTHEWDPGNLGYNSTTLFYTNGGTTSAITLIGVQVASLSDTDFLFA